MIKYIIFTLHYLFIFYILNPFYIYNTIIAILVYLHWYVNNNYCILSQLEYKYFKQTFIFQANTRPISKLEKRILILSLVVKLVYFTFSYLGQLSQTKMINTN